MGPAPISSAELMAWCSGTQTDLEPWEFEAIRSASRAFVGQYMSDDPFEPNSEKPEQKGSAVRSIANALNPKAPA